MEFNGSTKYKKGYLTGKINRNTWVLNVKTTKRKVKNGRKLLSAMSQTLSDQLSFDVVKPIIPTRITGRQKQDENSFQCISSTVGIVLLDYVFMRLMGWVGLWGFLWWAPSAKREDHHGVNSGWNSTWFHSNTGLSSTKYEQIPIIFGVWPFWLTLFFFQSMTFWRVYG